MAANEIVEKYGSGPYFVFRIIIGLLFLGHGLIWLGLIGGTAAQIFSIFWFAGIIEVVAGTAVVLGLFTRLAAAVGIVEMLIALLIEHIPDGLNIYKNGGELALLFFAAFLALFVYGAGKWQLDELLFKKEFF